MPDFDDDKGGLVLVNTTSGHHFFDKLSMEKTFVLIG